MPKNGNVTYSHPIQFNTCNAKYTLYEIMITIFKIHESFIAKNSRF